MDLWFKIESFENKIKVRSTYKTYKRRFRNYWRKSIREEFPEFKLDYWTQNIFGDFIDGGYSYDFSEYDRKVIAIEYLDFIKSKFSQEEPEVGIIEGINSLSLAYAFIESGFICQKNKV